MAGPFSTPGKAAGTTETVIQTTSATSVSAALTSESAVVQRGASSRYFAGMVVYNDHASNSCTITVTTAGGTTNMIIDKFTLAAESSAVLTEDEYGFALEGGETVQVTSSAATSGDPVYVIVRYQDQASDAPRDDSSYTRTV